MEIPFGTQTLSPAVPSGNPQLSSERSSTLATPARPPGQEGELTLGCAWAALGDLQLGAFGNTPVCLLFRFMTPWEGGATQPTPFFWGPHGQGSVSCRPHSEVRQNQGLKLHGLDSRATATALARAAPFSTIPQSFRV